METTAEVLAQEQNLADLRAGSLRLMAAFTGSIGLVWFLLVNWPGTGGDSPSLAAWAGGVLLVLGAAQTFLLPRRLFGFSSLLLVGSTFLAAPCGLVTLRSAQGFSLFILPIIFGSMLLGQWAVFVLAALAGALSATLGIHTLGLAPTSPETWLPVIMILLTAGASWVAARNLYAALGWVWSGYEQAHHNEQIARAGQAELRRVLKALDEATYRLERANQMLTAARDQAEEARRLKQRFAQTISHELRTPLNLIVGFSELMAQSPEYYGSVLPPTYMRDLTIVHRNACHLQGLVNDVLDLARIEAAEMGLLLEEVAPAELVEEAVSTARSLVEARGLALRAEVEAGLPILWVDPTRIRQVLFNLLNNAARFTDEGGITIDVRREGDSVLFSVSDTGVGIAAEDLARIFQEFEQADGSTRRRHGGAGLGLAISRRFVELHGGRIWAESQVGRGSTFHFALPIARRDPLAETGQPPAQAAPAAAPEPEPDAILLTVTRSQAVAALLGRYVRNCRSLVFPDLEQAQRAATQLLPQGVVVDTTDQPLDAAGVQALAQSWGLPRACFLATPLPGEASLQERLAVQGYLVKPVSRQALWDTLRQFGKEVDRVLLIDDERDFVRLMTRLLDSPLRRYQVMTADSGHKGLELIAHQPPDLVLLDLGLPDMDGSEVLKQMRANPQWQQIPVVIVSARDDIAGSGPLAGPLVIARAGGITPGELVRWVQGVVRHA